MWGNLPVPPRPLPTLMGQRLAHERRSPSARSRGGNRVSPTSPLLTTRCGGTSRFPHTPSPRSWARGWPMSALAACAAFPAAAAVIWATLRTRLASRVVAAPSEARWHVRTTPSLGGVGIFLGLVSGAGVAMAVHAVRPSEELFGILAGCTLLFAAGLADDLLTLSPLAKLGAQLGSAAIVLSTGLKVQIVSNDVLGVAIA